VGRVCANTHINIKIGVMATNIKVLWHICSKQELWNHENSCCYAMTMKGADIQHPFLGKGSVNKFSLLGNRFLIMQQLGCDNGNGGVSTWFITISKDKVSLKVGSVKESVKRGLEGMKLKSIHC
jgi:hypothetical protein